MGVSRYLWSRCGSLWSDCNKSCGNVDSGTCPSPSSLLVASTSPLHWRRASHRGFDRLRSSFYFYLLLWSYGCVVCIYPQGSSPEVFLVSSYSSTLPSCTIPTKVISLCQPNHVRRIRLNVDVARASFFVLCSTRCTICIVVGFACVWCAPRKNVVVNDFAVDD